MLHTYIHTLHYITVHYITLQYITLHYITLHYITLHYITFITLHYITYIYPLGHDFVCPDPASRPQVNALAAVLPVLLAIFYPPLK